MPSFAPELQKKTEEGETVTIYRDSTGAYYVGAAGDPECHPMPMGAFLRLDGARAWADRRFQGGTWGRAPEDARLPAGTHLPPATASAET